MEVLRVDCLQGVEQRMLRSVIAPIAQIQAPNEGHQLPHGRVPAHIRTCLLREPFHIICKAVTTLSRILRWILSFDSFIPNYGMRSMSANK